MKSFFSFFVLGVSLSLGAGCSGDGDLTTRLDGDQTTAQFQMKLQPSSSTTSARLALQSQISVPDSGIQIDSARLYIEEVELELPEGLTCDDAGFVEQDGATCKTETEVEDGMEETESEIDIVGPFVFDLVTGESTPAIGDISLPSGLYKEIEIKIKKAEEGDSILDASDPLMGHSILVEGSFTDANGDSHGFSMALEIDEELEVENAAGAEVLEGTVNQVVASLDPVSWFTGVDLDGCLDSGDYAFDSNGDLVIRDDDDIQGSGTCENLEEAVEEAVKNSMELFEEDDDESDDDPSDDDSSEDTL